MPTDDHYQPLAPHMPARDMPEPMLLMPVRVYGSFHDGGDGSVSIRWFARLEDAKYDQDHLSVGWGEECIETIHTYEGSAEWLEAIQNSLDQAKEKVREG